MLIVPLVPINPMGKNFGIICLASSTIHEWTKSELNLLKQIIKPLVCVIWDIMKINEIKELRDSFILTLT